LTSKKVLCPTCDLRQEWDTTRLKNELKKLVNDEFELLEKYKGTDTKINFKHNICHGVFPSTPNAFLKNPKCPICQADRSMGEKYVIDFLNKNNINFIREYRFEDCRNIYPLAFDFALFKEDELVCLVEFDGAHHYLPLEVFGGFESFIENKKKDKIKNDYCKKNNIKIIRIPFWEIDNIPGYFKKAIRKLKLHNKIFS
jgi:hypothetical protein